MASERRAETTAPAGIDHLLDVLRLEPAGPDAFRGRNVVAGRKRIYGGQVLAQAILAGCRTVPADRPLHSIHAYFLVGGQPADPVTYTVTRLRDGGSFSTRRVIADQGQGAIFAMMASFHAGEPGLTHAVPPPAAPPPESLPTVPELLARPDVSVPETMRAFYSREAPMDLRYVDVGRFTGDPDRTPTQRIWVRARNRLPDGLALHQALMAYASDFALVETALIAHGRLVFGTGMQLASLDHALWFHRPFRVDEWVLYVIDSPQAAGARGYSRGAFFTADGEIVASVCQELLMRPERALVQPKT
jgi:acyl-CoA thioesterase-2